MAIQEKTLGQSSITNSGTTTIYTVPASTTTVVKTIWICNTTTSDVTLELWNVPNGDSAADANKLMDGVTIPASDFIQVITYLPLETAGDTIQATGSTNNALTINIYGAEIT